MTFAQPILFKFLSQKENVKMIMNLKKKKKKKNPEKKKKKKKKKKPQHVLQQNPVV